MDIHDKWQQSQESDDMLNKLLQQKDFHHHQSKMPLKKLKNNLVVGIFWVFLINGAYLSVFIFTSIWQVNFALTVLVIFNTWIMVDSWRLYKNTNESISSPNSLREELQKNYTSFQKWWSIQLRASLFVFPIAVSGGFILGGVVGSGKTVEAFLYNPRMFLILGITMLVLCPLCYYVAKWIFHYSYGKHLKKLKVFIDELSQ